MKFKTQFNYSDLPTIAIEPGKRFKDEFQLRIVDGIEELVKVGETDFYEYIQSHKDSVDIHKILERCALIDDYSMLNKMPTTFMDTTGMPSNLMEAYQQIQDAKNFFDQMPVSIKEKYDNNANAFIMDIGSKNFMNNVSEFLDTIKKKDEVKVNEES